MCAINFHSIINSGLIPGGQNLSNRQTVFFLPVDSMDKNHKEPDTIDLNAPRHAQYLHKAWKKHQNAVNWVDIEDDETESELSLEFRSFLHRVNDQVRQRQKQSSMDATEDSEEHSMIWECSCLQHCKHLYSWKEFLRQLPFHHENIRSHIETSVRHINKIGVSLDWKQLVGRIIH